MELNDEELQEYLERRDREEAAEKAARVQMSYKFVDWLESIRTDMSHQKRVEEEQRETFKRICKKRGIKCDKDSFSEYFTELLNGQVRSINEFFGGDKELNIDEVSSYWDTPAGKQEIMDASNKS